MDCVVNLKERLQFQADCLVEYSVLFSCVHHFSISSLYLRLALNVSVEDSILKDDENLNALPLL